MAGGAYTRARGCGGLLLVALSAPGCLWTATAGTVRPAELARRLSGGRPSCAVARPRALVVGIDGLGRDALTRAATPVLDGLRARGAYSLEGQSGDLAKSGPSWATVLTGVWRDRHGVDSNRFIGHRLGAHPDLFMRVARWAPGRRTALVASWPQLHHFGQAADLRVFEPFATCQDRCAEAAAQVILSRSDVDLLFVYLQAVDEVGHVEGFGPDIAAYRAAIEAADRRLGRILAAVAARCPDAPEDWLVVVTTDHGGGALEPRGHGANAPEERDVLVLVARAQAAAGGGVALRPAPQHVDVAPTILAHLGLPPAAWAGLDGRPIDGRARPAPAWGANLLVNPGFEAGRVAADGVDAPILGWRSFGCGRLEPVGDGRGGTGAHRLGHNGNKSCEVTQAVDLPAGQGGARTYRLRADVGGAAQVQVVFHGPEGVLGWGARAEGPVPVGATGLELRVRFTLGAPAYVDELHLGVAAHPDRSAAEGGDPR